jgi:hypothetical protein
MISLSTIAHHGSARTRYTFLVGCVLSGLSLISSSGCQTYWRGDYAKFHCPSDDHAAAQRVIASRYAHAALLNSSAGNAGYTETHWASLEPTPTYSRFESFSQSQPSGNNPSVSDPAVSVPPVRDAAWQVPNQPGVTDDEQQIKLASHVTLRRQLLALGYQNPAKTSDVNDSSSVFNQQTESQEESALDFINVEILK